jgi:hypothetical protein
VTAVEKVSPQSYAAFLVADVVVVGGSFLEDIATVVAGVVVVVENWYPESHCEAVRAGGWEQDDHCLEESH